VTRRVGGRIKSTHARGALPHAARYFDLDAAPPARDYTGARSWGLFGNDRVGDCTIASLYDRRQVLASLHRESFTWTTDQALADYTALNGYDGTPGDASDRGCQMIDVLAHAKNVGIAGQRIAGYARIDPLNRVVMEAALNAFCFLYVGANLPKAVDAQGFEWRMPAIRTDDDEPDPDRGHAFGLVGYDRLGYRGLTWGSSRYRIDNAWAELCIDEVWVAFDEALVSGTRAAPNGFDLARLRDDLAAL
jgi:hypothetical protein